MLPTGFQYNSTPSLRRPRDYIKPRKSYNANDRPLAESYVGPPPALR